MDSILPLADILYSAGSIILMVLNSQVGVVLAVGVAIWLGMN